MPNPPFAKILVSINNQAPTSGGLLAGFGETVTFSAQSTVGWTSARWEIYDYPPGFSAPAGWSTDPSGVIFFQPSNQTTPPPTFTLPSTGTNTWGKWALRLRINGNPLQFNQNGSPNTSFVAQYTDETTVFSIPSPKLGMHGVAFNETIQYDTLRAAVGEIMQALRQIDASSSSGGGFVPPTGSGLVVVVSGALSPAASLGTAAQIPIVNAAGTNFAWQTVTGILALSATGVASLNGVVPWTNGGRLQGIAHVTNAAPGALNATTQIALVDSTTGATSVSIPPASAFGGTIPDGFPFLVADTGGAAAASAISITNATGLRIVDPTTGQATTGTITLASSWAAVAWIWDATKLVYVPTDASLMSSFRAPGASSGGALVLSPASPRWNLVVADDLVTGPNPWPVGEEWLFTNDLLRSSVDLGSGHPVTFQRPAGATYTFENPQNRALTPAASVVWTVGGETIRWRNDGSIIRCVN